MERVICGVVAVLVAMAVGTILLVVLDEMSETRRGDKGETGQGEAGRGFS